ncbi:hypothetical protein [Roseovarius sp. D0-M9]|uniref:hypothetical protein n=1 Tax=Roseovarius sp. D0-M9 TaxID=3127117 RepID=UPI00300FA8D2
MTVSHQSLLDAMDGITMVLDSDLHIAQIGEPNWLQFFEDNAPQDKDAQDRSNKIVLDQPVTQFIAGDAVRRTFTDLFNSVLSKKRAAVQFDYRCDAPKLRRDMRLSVRPIKNDDDVSHLLYQSITLSVQQRPALPLFGAAVADHDAEDILTLCAICARVAWPIGAPTGRREWIEPSEYYRRGGDEVALLSHGFCKDCFARIQEED